MAHKIYMDDEQSFTSDIYHLTYLRTLITQYEEFLETQGLSKEEINKKIAQIIGNRGNRLELIQVFEKEILKCNELYAETPNNNRNCKL